MTITELYEIFCAHPIITTDTRNCPAGSIFFALKGERFNGNLFAEKALQAGCAYAVVDENINYNENEDGRLILVDDVLQTLQELAHEHRKHFGGPVIQITGTNGKTTTKELVAAVLAEHWHVHYTQGNFNNHIGVPKTLLGIPSSCSPSPAVDGGGKQAGTPQEAKAPIAVIETGANHPGEIALLTRIVDPDCGLITNVGRAHLEGFGSFEGVIRTKTELYDYLRQKPGAFIFLHADNAHLAPRAEGIPAITYGHTGHGYEVEGEVVECNPYVKIRWHVAGQEWHEVQTQLIGAYNLDNMLAAATVGLRYGVSTEQIDHALATYVPHLGRSELKRTASNTLIVDAYNANATSMAAALENFRQIPADKKIAILGEMRELGAASRDAHKEVLDQALGIGLNDLWLVGREFAAVAEGTQTRCFASVEEVKAALQAEPISGALILIKGSNGTHLYELPEKL